MEIGSRLKFIRKLRCMSLRDVAAKARCSVAVLSEIELNHVSPTLRTMEKVCTSLDITVADFLRIEPVFEEPVVINRDRTRHKILMRWRDVRLLQLLPEEMETPFTALMLEFDPGGVMPIRNALSSLKELCMVVKGQVELRMSETVRSLHTGESIYFDLMVPHQWANPGETSAEVLLMSPNSFRLFEQFEEDIRWYVRTKREKRKVA
jgi:transcriptional regulator with XRE-family HTH domain